jgi:hypothetical protein
MSAWFITERNFDKRFVSRAVLQEDPYTRIKSVVKWYLSGFYKKPKVSSGFWVFQIGRCGQIGLK